MKKILVLAASLFLSCLVQAQSQPWMKNFENGPVKLQDVIDQWNKTHNSTENDEVEVKGEEDDNYQFDRWVNYWKSHTDENGYLVSPVHAMKEWLRYRQQYAATHATARTTGTPAWAFAGPKIVYNDGKNGEGIGRIISAAYHPTDTNTFWVGTAGGGAWKTTDGGKTWTCITDNSIFPIRGISDIVVNPLNPNTIYLCTGDRDAKDCYSIGVLKSYDGGITWDTTGIVLNESSGNLTNSMVINKLDTNTLILATGFGLYRSLNGGATFNSVLSGYFNQVLYNPADTNILYAAYGTNIVRSADGGATWTLVTGMTGAIRVAMAVCPQNPAIVKAISANSGYGIEGFYSSSDTGKTFSRIYNADTGCSLNILSFDPKLRSSSCGGQGWYDLCIVINPLDSNSVYIGGVNNWHSIDGGAHWKISSQWTKSITSLEVVHADKHYLGYNPINPHYIYEGNDGGIYVSSYRSSPDTTGALWTDLTNGLGITQFYRIAVSDLGNYTVGGAQDNGSKQVVGDTVYQPGGADGMTCQVDYTDPNIFYFSSQYGSISITTDGGNTSHNISKNISSPAPTGAWTTPFVIDPIDHETLYAGYSRLYTSSDKGQTWNVISALAASANIDRIAVSAADHNYIYILSGGTIRSTSDGGATWKNILGSYGAISDIAVDPNDPKHIWVVYSGYATNHVGEYSQTTAKWTMQNGTLPKIPMHCICIDKENSTMYIGSDVGIFYRTRYMSDWDLYNNGLPVVQVNDLEINYTTGEIWAGTYGRSMWKTAKAGPYAGILIVPYADDIITVSPNPNKGHFIVSSTNTSFINKNVTATLVNTLGQTVWQGMGSFNSNGILQINTNELAKGPYILQVSTGAMVARTRIIILQ